MNYKNNEMLTAPNLSYTSRDYKSIYDELYNSISTLTSEWKPNNENDPGIVLLKMISMLGDMLSYNQDKQALEAFPRTVLQRANAQTIFRLIGYKMHWWRSPRITSTFVNNNDFSIYVGRYNLFTTRDSNIVYTNLRQFNIPAAGQTYEFELIQGRPVTPIKKSNVIIYDDNWHDIYDYNVSVSDFVGNRLYLSHKNIDETSITLIDNDEKPFNVNEWTLVPNINLSESMDKVFEFDVDENNNPYIQLPNYWKEKFIITKFKLFYVLSDGINGEIEENTIISIDPKNCVIPNSNINVINALSAVTMFNTPSTYGMRPETCTEARINSEKYQNTIDTLVILRDFEKAVLRLNSVANVIATDLVTDPFGYNMGNYEINLYCVRKNDFNNSYSSQVYSWLQNDTESIANELFKENVINSLQKFKLMPYNINVFLENRIDWIDWTIRGQIYLRHPICIAENEDLMSRINIRLQNTFNVETLDFNEPINYMDVIECVMKTDKNIWHVDLDTAAIEYSKVKRSLFGDPTGNKFVNKYMIYGPDENGKLSYSGYYLTSLGCTDIEINRLKEFQDTYNDIYDSEDFPGYLPGNGGGQGLDKTISIMETGNVVPGGNGYGKNMGNRIVREDGIQYVIGLDLGRPNEPREYEVYNKYIWDWTGVEPVYTGYIIDTSTSDYYTIKKYNDDYDSSDPNSKEYLDTDYKIYYDSRMYLEDGTDANRQLKTNYRQITQLCTINDEDDIYSNDKIKDLTDIQKQQLVSKNILREVYDIIDTIYNSWTGECIDKLTGEIFIMRGNYWYSTNTAYNEETGDICFTNGPAIVDENDAFIMEPACKEDVTGEYVIYYDVRPNQVEFDFYLGQDNEGKQLLNSIGNNIVGYPVSPYSLKIFVTTSNEEEILSDTGTGRIHGTNNILNGFGTIDYTTGHISFKLNVSSEAPLKIIYKVNRLTYTRYNSFNPQTFFVRPEYIRNTNLK